MSRLTAACKPQTLTGRGSHPLSFVDYERQRRDTIGAISAAGVLGTAGWVELANSELAQRGRALTSRIRACIAKHKAKHPTVNAPSLGFYMEAAMMLHIKGRVFRK